jgi:hypothetical protein
MAGDILKIYFISFAYHNSYTGPPRAWRGPGANFFRGPYFKNYFVQKITGAQQKISRGPQNLGARGNLPPPLGGPEGDDARHGQRPLFGNHFVSDIPWRFMLEMMSLSSLLSLV